MNPLSLCGEDGTQTTRLPAALGSGADTSARVRPFLTVSKVLTRPRHGGPPRRCQGLAP